MKAFVSSYCILFCPVLLLSLGGCSFLKRKQKGTGSGREGRWEGLRGVEKGETVVGMYHMRKVYIFNKQIKA